MDLTRRQDEIVKPEQSIERRAEEIERLRSVVGDPDEVVDEHGWLSRERRDRMLTYYLSRRSRLFSRSRAAKTWHDDQDRPSHRQ